MLQTFYCLPQFVVQLLLLIGQVGNITGQGAISLLQLDATGQEKMNTVNLSATATCCSVSTLLFSFIVSSPQLKKKIILVKA